jgi:hypothetical protein
MSSIVSGVNYAVDYEAHDRRVVARRLCGWHPNLSKRQTNPTSALPPKVTLHTRMVYKLRREEAMRPDKVQVSWDAAKSNWLVRIQIGEEVVRRYCSLPKNADEATLRSAAQKTVVDEGYEADPASIVIGH